MNNDTVVPISDVLTLLEKLDVVVYTIDREGRTTWITGAIRDVLGYAPEEVVGRKVEDFVAPESFAVVSRQLRRKLTGEAELTIYEYLARAKDGSRVPVQVTSMPLRQGGAISGVIGVFHVAGRRSTSARKEALPSLTPRQHEVLQLLGEGLTTRAIAARLDVSLDTARNHIRAVLAALDCHSRLEAVAAARSLGLI